MNTKFIMSFSALIMGASGISLSFFPDEMLRYINVDPGIFLRLILQLMGALYFAFAMMNWTAKENLIGGIYGRPIVMGNLTHGVVGSLALVKGASLADSPLLWFLAVIYSIVAVLFGMIVFRHPSGVQKL